METREAPIDRSYQDQAVAAALETKRLTIQMPTATGKTVVGIRILNEVLKSRPNFRWIILVPKEEVLRRWCRDLPGCGVYYGKEKRLTQVTVSIYNSGVLHPDIMGLFDGIIADEVHHVSAPAFARILELTRRHEYVIGLTATFERTDGLHQLAAIFAPVRFRMTVAQAQKIGAQCPLNLLVVKVQLPPLLLAQVQMYDRIVSKGFHRQRQMGLWSQLGMRRELEAASKRKTLLSFAEEKVTALMAIARANPGKRILVFGGSIAAVDRLAEIMRQHGLPAEAYHSQLDPEKSKQINTNEFAAWGRDFHVLFAVQKLDEGVDVPEAKIAVMLASGKGDLQMIQRTGRIMRPSKLNEPAQLYLIVASKTSEESLQHKTVQALELPADHVHVTTAKELFKQLSYTPENVLPSQ